MEDNREEIFREKFNHMAGQIEVTSEQKERIWKDMQNVRRPVRLPAVKAASIAVAVMLFVAGGTLSVNAATGGKFFDSIAEVSSMDISLFEKIKYVCGNKEHQKQVAKETVKVPNEVYAPKLVACSNKYIVWANERGLMVYDRENDTVESALDLQEMGCNFLNSDTIETCIFMKDEILYIFNIEKESKLDADSFDDNETDANADNSNDATLIQEMVYSYKLSKAGEEGALDMITDAGELAKIKKAWTAYRQSNIRDTFDEMQENAIDLNELAGHDDTSYSEDCIAWTSKDGKELESFLVVMADGRYLLYTRTMKDDSLEELELSVVAESADNLGDNGETEALPAFIYSGDDEVIRALCVEAMKEEDSYLRTSGSVFIPVPYVYETVNDGEDVVVFCDLSAASYYQNGNTLNCESGGSVPARIRLTPDGNGGYQVTEHLNAEDGGLYIESIEKFCNEYNVSPEIYNNNNEGEDMRKQFIKMYVTDNNLAIKYYKDYGWDPVPVD